MVATRGCAVIAHRGGAGEAPENTWTAVEHVAELGLTWMETDLRVSADGLVILSHDRDLTRTAADPRGIGEMTWKELSELDAGDGRPPVRLDDALAAFPRLRLPFCSAPVFLVRLLRLLRSSTMLRRCRIRSIDDYDDGCEPGPDHAEELRCRSACG